MPSNPCWRAQVPCIYPVGEHRGGRDKTIMAHNQEKSNLENMVEKLGDLVDVVPGSKSSSISNFEHAAFEIQPRLPVDISALSSHQDPSRETLEGGAFASDQDGPAQARDLHNKFARLVLHEQSGGKRYVSDGFWAKLDDELSSLRRQSPQSEDDGLDDSDFDDIGDSAAPDPASADPFKG
ncbi:hypothetical protein EDB80DRAFT_815840 [Ilyonectria destructans]|nr:hypothetical protein EDB80DRAFT_815840 [Ilyonectria destructans]